ncbi:MAG TPA: hypothetical protein VGU22_15780 [Methylomirabilota bacterium]|nr:hypothetical protein [Methylomirabilota bacterium]
MTGELSIVHDDADGRIVVTDSLTFCDARVGGRDVIIGGSFAGAPAFAFAVERGVRALIGHEAGIGKDAAGISGLPFADGYGVPAAAVETFSARIGDGASVAGGVIAHVNERGRALGVAAGQRAGDAARRLLKAPALPRPWPGLVDRTPRVVEECAGGRVVLVASMAFAERAHARDVLCAGSHGGRVNVARLLEVRPRGAIFNDAGMARDRSGIDGLPLLDAARVAAVAVAAMSARIGDPASAWETGVVSAVNATAARAGVVIGTAARDAALRILAAPDPA